MDNKSVPDIDINHTDNFNVKPLKQALSEHITEIKETVTESNQNLSVWLMYAIFVLVIGICINAKYNSFDEFMNRFTQLTVNMYWGFGFLVITLGFLMLLERLYPDRPLNNVEGWWKWVVIINVFQLFAVVLASVTWENWLQNTNYFTSSTGFHLRDHVCPLLGGLIAYVINQWLFYHWHKARHEIYFLWILFHQFHHSPSRIETITSFYKHPFEIIIDSQIMAILLYSVLGLSNESSVWLSIFSGIGEYVYHMNIKTPKLMGYIFQRPESHRCHHRRNKRIHCPNYSDFPLWDILGGTFENPNKMDDDTGFSPEFETKRIDMIFLKDVLISSYQNIFSDYKKFKTVFIRYIWYILVLWGALNSTAFLVHNDSVKNIGFVSVSSPLPLVFSKYNGVETYATEFNATVLYQNTSILNVKLDAHRYSFLTGAYNRKNVYGAIFTHGPFFNQDSLIKIRQNILHYAICNPASIVEELKIDAQDKIKSLNIDVIYRQNRTKIGELFVECGMSKY